MTRRVWTEHELAVLHRDYPHQPTAQIAKQLGRTIGQVYQAADRHGLHKSTEYLASPHACRLRRDDPVGKQHRYQPGHPTWNKGLPGSTGHHPHTAAHHFRPGTINGRAAQLLQPIGALRVNDDGCLYRKVRDDGRPSRRWIGVHRLVWEAEHGPIPAGHVVVFRPGRRTTDPDQITLDALELVTRRELMLRNSTHRHGTEIARLSQLRGAITRQINKRLRAQREAP